MISWPCLLKLDGDNELIYLDSERVFRSQCQGLILTDDDYIVDCAGNSYLIKSVATAEQLALIKTQRILVAEQVTELIRAHEFNKAELCLTKIHFLTVSAAIKSLSYEE